jgi:Spy/CpxP family protein refolding chaperone
MSTGQNSQARIFVFVAILATALATSSVAQGPSGGMGGPPRNGGLAGPGYPGGGPNNGPDMHGPPQGGFGGGLQLGPPGRWWDDKQFAGPLKLRPDQRAHMDAIFDQNRNSLRARLDAVRQAEDRMHDLATAPQPDEAALFAQIDRISQARSELDKTTTHMLLLIRREMDPAQIKLLEQLDGR